MCKEVKEEEIEIEGKRFTVKYQTAVACELPERWENFQIQEQEQQVPKADHQNSQQYAWPPGPYGALPGFYHNFPGSGDPNMNKGGMKGHFPGQQPMPGNEQQQGHGPQQGYAPHPGQGHDPQRGQGYGQGMNFPFGPGGLGLMPPGFPPGYQMFRMPPPYQNISQGGHNMPSTPRFPMKYFPAQGFPEMQQPPKSHRHTPGDDSGQSTEVKSHKSGAHNDGN
ncbi:annexin A7-like [Ruditapes philippinarum]|uniref:annexin A7-like n=1 Tax=Ruditapes philippinarum TaxID=129788 RepID=UPI00295BF55C|nr:annexin A7-like [Ruditapes philippinarum]